MLAPEPGFAAAKASAHDDASRRALVAAAVVIGALGGPFGINGWVHVRSFTDPPGNLLHYQPWHLCRGTDWQPVDAEIKAHRNGFVACIDGSADRDAAVALRGAEIGVPAAVLPPAAPDEYYWRELIGCRVAAHGAELGRVAKVFATPAHDVMVVEHAGGTEMIPFVRQIVSAVDIDAQRIDVDWQLGWA